jgi:hypothetical protein
MIGGRSALLTAKKSGDADAIAYIAAIEAADGSALEPATATAIVNFVAGCKSDGIWTAIKACCILAGARTLAGALVPLVGTAPTNNGFSGADYNRKTGLKGNGTSKYLNSNRANSLDPQNNCHVSVWKSDAISGANPYFIGSSTSGYAVNKTVGQFGMYSNSSDSFADSLTGGVSSAQGLHGNSRDGSNSVNFIRPESSNVEPRTRASTTPPTFSIHIFGVNHAGSPSAYTSSAISFYSIGESLNLLLLRNRVSTLLSAYSAAIP